MQRDTYPPWPAFPPLPGLLLALAFSACNQASAPEEPAGPSRLMGRYEVSGTMIILHSPPDTMRFCDGDSLVEDVEEARSDTAFYRLSGDRLWLSSDFKSHTPDGSPFTLRRHTGLRRLAAGEGLGGWWRSDTGYNEVMAGTLDPETQADQDRYLRASLAQLRYLQLDLGFFAGEVRMRQDGRMAELFLAEWNGEIDFDPVFTPDSAEYDIEVSVVDSYTVRLTGRVTGEVVTVTFDRSNMDSRYSSADPGREPYRSMEGPSHCPGGDWFQEFKWENYKESPIFKSGAGRSAKKSPDLVRRLPFIP